MSNNTCAACDYFIDFNAAITLCNETLTFPNTPWDFISFTDNCGNVISNSTNVPDFNDFTTLVAFYAPDAIVQDTGSNWLAIAPNNRPSYSFFAAASYQPGGIGPIIPITATETGCIKTVLFPFTITTLNGASGIVYNTTITNSADLDAFFIALGFSIKGPLQYIKKKSCVVYTDVNFQLAGDTCDTFTVSFTTSNCKTISTLTPTTTSLNQRNLIGKIENKIVSLGCKELEWGKIGKPLDKLHRQRV